ncbi:MAG TPA: 50S ribosomal protein L25 [Acidimicrobiales bacterium]|nr:50S ribosomal protein L25 [Acidimicrobiales bacterium]
MAEIQLVAETGREPGTRSSKRLRREGKIPGVVYGHGTEPVAVAVDARELRHALNTEAGVNALINLSIDGSSKLTMPRVLQRHPVRNTVTHVDFQVVSRDEVMAADVPFTLVGEAKEVTNNEGVVEQALFALTIHATPSAIPAHIEVDISKLTIGEAIRVGDLKLPAGVTTEVDPDEAIVVAQGAQTSELDLIPEADIEGLHELAEAVAAEEAGEGGEDGGDAGRQSGEGGEAPAES